MSIALVKDPVYCQLNALLRDLIRSGQFRPGERFLTEREISQRYGISRATANKALSNLVSEHIVEFKKGVGTFVRGGMLDYDLRALVSFTEKARAAGRVPSTQVLNFKLLARTEVPEDIAVTLRLGEGEGERAYWIERLRLADDIAVILERRYLVARHCPGLSAEALNESLYKLLTERFQLNVSGAEERISAISIEPADAVLLRVPAGSAGLLVTAVGQLGNDQPLWHERTLYRGDAYEFRNALGPIRTPRPAAGVLVGPAGRVPQ